jgi:DNA-binding Lrp family transcriptional regulator
MDERLDSCDRMIVNLLQDGIPIRERPFKAAARRLGIEESELLSRLERLQRDGVLTRFGPLYQIERAGGAFLLAAMQIPPPDVERVAGLINALPEVAHNYLRSHRFNLWFVIATPAPEEAQRVVAKIEADTGHPVYAMPKLKEYFLDLRLPV